MQRHESVKSTIVCAKLWNAPDWTCPVFTYPTTLMLSCVLGQRFFVANLTALVGSVLQYLSYQWLCLGRECRPEAKRYISVAVSLAKLLCGPVLTR